MPSSYTTNGGIEKIASGEQSGSWGTTTNTNFDILDRITNGVGTIDLSGSAAAHTLETQDGTLSDGMFKVLVLDGATEACTITVTPNDAQKLYFVNNASGYDCTFTQGSGANVTVTNGKTTVIYCNGGGATAAVVDLTASFALSGALLAANNLSDVADAGTSRTNLGVAVGTDVLAYDSNLQSFVDTFTLPTSDGTSNYVLATDGSGTLSFSERTTPAQAKGYAVAFSIVFGA